MNYRSPPKKAKIGKEEEPSSKKKHPYSVAGVELGDTNLSDISDLSEIEDEVEDAAPVASTSVAAFTRAAAAAAAIASPKPVASPPLTKPAPPTSTPAPKKKSKRLDSNGKPIPTARKSTTPRKIPRAEDDSVVETSVVEASSPSSNPSPFVFIPDDRHPLAPHVPTTIDPEGLVIKQELETLSVRVREARSRKFSGNNED